MSLSFVFTGDQRILWCMELDEYSLWLEPDASNPLFRELITRCAEKVQTTAFEPHVTLLGGLHISASEIQSYMETLARDHQPFSISFTTVDYADFFYKALFAPCEENKALLALNAEAQTLFKVEAPYLPHMSFLYGDVPMVQKEHIATDIVLPHLPLSFVVRGISLWHAKGSVDNWKKIHSVVFAL